jgi:hypothetical protein
MVVKIPRIKINGTTTPSVTLARRLALIGQNLDPRGDPKIARKLNRLKMTFHL